MPWQLFLPPTHPLSGYKWKNHVLELTPPSMGLGLNRGPGLTWDGAQRPEGWQGTQRPGEETNLSPPLPHRLAGPTPNEIDLAF